MHSAFLLDLPLTGYTEALALQRAAVQARHDGLLERDLIIMVEHPPVFTLGRRGGRQNLLVSEAALQQNGIAVVPIERGGDITYHGPGQLVVYPLVHLGAAGIKVVDFVDMLETAMVRTAARWQVKARGDAEHRGAWVADRKLGSVGITVRHGISFHGLALNVATDLTPFGWINPCGIQSCQMTSLVAETGHSVAMADVRRVMAKHLGDLLEVTFETIEISNLSFEI